VLSDRHTLYQQESEQHLASGDSAVRDGARRRLFIARVMVAIDRGTFEPLVATQRPLEQPRPRRGGARTADSI
jgi:hypothetical protein